MSSKCQCVWARPACVWEEMALQATLSAPAPGERERERSATCLCITQCEPSLHPEHHRSFEFSVAGNVFCVCFKLKIWERINIKVYRKIISYIDWFIVLCFRQRLKIRNRMWMLNKPPGLRSQLISCEICSNKVVFYV